MPWNTDAMISLSTSSYRTRNLLVLLASLSSAACADAPRQPVPRSSPVTPQNTASETGHLCGVRSAKRTPDGVEVRFTKPTLVLARFDGKARRVMVNSTASAAPLPPGAEVSAPAVLALPGDTISIPTSAHSGCSIVAKVKDGVLGLSVTLGVGAPGLEPYWKTDFIPAE